MAMTAWVAKFLTSAICLSVKGTNFLTIDSDSADQSVLLEHRDVIIVRMPPFSPRHKRLKTRLICCLLSGWAT